MDPLLLAALTFAAFGTATLSATFGMAGGLVLMGLYTALLPVPQAMVLHGVTQLVANGGRAWLLRGHVHRGGLLAYAVGALAAWVLLRGVSWVPSQAAVFLGIGAVPFVAFALPPSPALDFARRRGAALCGLLVAGTQLAFGVAGPLLDVFFVRTALLRREVVATKATTQAFSHLLKIAYFAPLLAAGMRADRGASSAADLAADRALDAMGPTAPAAGRALDAIGPTALAADTLALTAGVSVLAAVVGTRVGGRLLERIGEDTFRRWTRRLVLAIGAVFLARGVWAAV